MSAVVTPGNLGPEFEIGTTTPSKITINVDGVTVNRDATTGELSAVQQAFAYDNATATLTIVTPGVAPNQTIDLSALTTDIYVNGAVLDATTNILTLSDNDPATPDVTIDLSAYTGVSGDAANLLTNGTDNKPFVDCAKIKADCTAACTDAFGVDIFNAFPV